MRIFVYCFPLFLSAGIRAQPAGSECTPIRAMRDELQRGMEKLALPNHARPFYMFARLAQHRSYYLEASMGTLMRDTEGNNFSLSNLRVLCGDYSFNDESFNQVGPGGYQPAIGFPKDSADYAGMRRALWRDMEQIYRRAASGLASNEARAKEKGLPIEQIPHRSFARVSPGHIIKSFTPSIIDKPAIRALLRAWSDSLQHIPGVINSDATFSYGYGYVFMSSTEGLTAKVPNSEASLSFSIECKDGTGVLVDQSVSLQSLSPSTLMSTHTFANLFSSLKHNVVLLENAKALEDTYTGPVLFQDEAVADVVLMTLLNPEENLLNDDALEADEGPRAMYFPKRKTLKMNTAITHPGITMSIDPFRAEYEGVELLGKFEIDDEGTVPIPVTLVESGVLKGLLNNRTLTAPNQSANGYAQPVRGVVELSVKKDLQLKDLRRKLTDEAAKEGLEYGILIQKNFGNISMYKVFVSDGHVEMIAPAGFPMLSIKSLKKLLGASEKTAAYNTRIGHSAITMPFRPMDLAMAILPIGKLSCIVPNGLLVGGVEIKADNYQRKAPKIYVPQPD